MSWKRLLSASLIALLASRAFAAPTASIFRHGNQANGHLNDAGDWVWWVQISPSEPVPNGSTRLNTELGFRETTNSELLSASQTGSPTTGFDSTVIFNRINPGQQIFGWETPGASGNPEGLQVNLATDEVFSALGSINLTTSASQNYLEIVCQGPSIGLDGIVGTADDRLRTTIQMLGAYPIATAGNGRIAELTGPSTYTNYDIYA